MKASSIKDELESNASYVKEFIISILKGDPTELYDASVHYITTGGKRLRPFMVAKSCEMFGGNPKRSMPAAVAVEMIHNFSLVHDDIMDNDDMRHSVSTVHKYYGMPLAILAGDILFSKAFQLIAINGRKAGIVEKDICEMIVRLSTACIHVCEGQATDVVMASNRTFSSESEYINMIGKKTAALFEVSCGLGVLSAADPNMQDVENLSSFGRNVGIAFQLIDDLIGIVGDPRITGKAVGNDIREGKKTFPLILVLEKAGSNERNKLLKIFGSRRTNDRELEEALRIISGLRIE